MERDDAWMWVSTACEGKCGAGSGVPVCTTEDGECEIQCGGDTYRDGDYCYRCDDSEGLCKECDGAGLCSVCRDGVDKVGKECENRQQAALDAIAEELRKISGLGGCVAPDVLRCTTPCAGSGCGTYKIELDSGRRVTKLFDSNNKQETTNTRMRDGSEQQRAWSNTEGDQLSDGTDTTERLFAERASKDRRVRLIFGTTPLLHFPTK